MEQIPSISKFTFSEIFSRFKNGVPSLDMALRLFKYILIGSSLCSKTTEKSRMVLFELPSIYRFLYELGREKTFSSCG